MSDTVSIDVHGAAEMLAGMDEIIILTHRNPDGDTLGSGYALWAGMMQKNINARVVCANEIHPMYDYLTSIHNEICNSPIDFSTGKIISIDTAAPSQLGVYEKLSGDIILSIDHHGSNTGYASFTLLDEHAASCAEIIYDILLALEADIDKYIASALYTGISTDTGCYRYRNTTARSHSITAKLIERGIDLAFLNKTLFETRSRNGLSLQKMALDSLDFYYHDRIVVITLTRDMVNKAGASEEDMSQINQIPRSIEGVEAGIVLRQLDSGMVKGSIRTSGLIDASKVCAVFSGGGHRGAAGFECSGDIVDVKMAVVHAVIAEFDRKKD